METAGRHPTAIMQNYLDKRLEEVKILANFDLEKEKTFYELSVYDFYFHISIKSSVNHGKEGH